MTTLTLISDTHNQHRDLVFKREEHADILVHCGDFSQLGVKEDYDDFIHWFIGLTGFKHKVFIAGNHDIYLEGKTAEDLNLPDNVHYLNQTGVTLEGLNFYGYPHTSWDSPPPYRWAFTMWDAYRSHFDEICAKIPMDTDVLMTHGPPKNILDKAREQHFGCPSLRERVTEVSPSIHCFGHIHESRGHIRWPNLDLDFYNAALTVHEVTLNKGKQDASI